MMLTRRSLAAGLIASASLGSWTGRPATAQSASGPASYPPALAFSQIVELSGPLSRAGDSWRNGVELAVQDINAAGGVLGSGLSMLTFDAEGGRAAIQRALEPPPLALLGPLGAATARVAASMARAAGLACITGTDAADLTSASGNVVRATPGPALRATRLCTWIAEHTEARRIGLAWGTLEPGRIGREIWGRALTAAGLDIVMEQGIPPTATSLAGPVGAFARPAIEAVLLLLPPADFVRFLHEARRQTLRAALLADLAPATAGTFAQAGTDAEGVRCQLDFLPDPPADQPDLAAMASFASRYRTTFHTGPDSPAARGYTAVGLLAAALTHLGRPDPTNLVTTLKGLSLKAGTPAILADTTITPSGDMIRPTFLTELHTGKPALLATLA